MYAYKEWERLLSLTHLKEHYYQNIAQRKSIGLDKITPQKFESELDENLEIIYRKITNETYHFTRYKQMLFVKSPQKPPRAVSVPTIRDKLTLSVLNELMVNVYGEKIKTRLPQLIIDELIENRDKYDSFIKLDIKQFYSSIDHKRLLSLLRKRIRKKEILTLIQKAIETDSILYPVKEKKKLEINTKGIPEGLPVSNALANLYLSALDEKYGQMNSIAYWRYVDDILIFVDSKDLREMEALIKGDVQNLGLCCNEKSDHGFIRDGFEYLGYMISSDLITVRQRSVFKIEQSIEELLRLYKKKSAKFIEWKLNNKITGFILNEKKYGWMFFYSQIDDLSLLFHLDNLVEKLLKRYQLAEKVHQKRFVRTYHEMSQALRTTNYIPNYSFYTLEQKRRIVEDIDGRDFTLLDEQIEARFQVIMAKEIKDIERDVENFS